VAGASLTPGIAAMLGRVGAAVPFGEGRDLLAELTGIELSTERVERTAETDGKAIAAAIDIHAAAVATGEVVPLGPGAAVAKLCIAVDGSGIPAAPADTAGRKGKTPTGRQISGKSSSGWSSPRPPSTTRGTRSGTRTRPATFPRWSLSSTSAP